MSQAARALFWRQPLTWVLHRQNMSAAEEVCEDIVIEHGCSREGYLRQLLEIAERWLPQASLASVSMVSFRSTLGRRAARILDTRRTLSTGVGRLFVAAALAVTLLATTAEQIRSVSEDDSSVTYPDSKLGQKSKLNSQLIKANIYARVYYTMQAGYDTHAGRLPTHGDLLGTLSSSFNALMDDL